MSSFFPLPHFHTPPALPHLLYIGAVVCQQLTEVREDTTVQHDLCLLVTACHNVSCCTQGWGLKKERCAALVLCLQGFMAAMDFKDNIAMKIVRRMRLVYTAINPDNWS